MFVFIFRHGLRSTLDFYLHGTIIHRMSRTSHNYTFFSRRRVIFHRLTVEASLIFWRWGHHIPRLWSSTGDAFCRYITALQLDYGEKRNEVPTLDRAGEEAVWPCIVHSQTFVIYASCTSFSPYTTSLLVLHDSHHTIRSTGSGSNRFVAVCTEVITEEDHAKDRPSIQTLYDMEDEGLHDGDSVKYFQDLLRRI